MAQNDDDAEFFEHSGVDPELYRQLRSDIDVAHMDLDDLGVLGAFGDDDVQVTLEASDMNDPTLLAELGALQGEDGTPLDEGSARAQDAVANDEPVGDDVTSMSMSINTKAPHVPAKRM